MLVEMTPVPGSDLPLASLAEHMRLSRGFTDDAELDSVQIESALRGALAAIEARTGKAVFRRRFVQTVPAMVDGGAACIADRTGGQRRCGSHHGSNRRCAGAGACGLRSGGRHALPLSGGDCGVPADAWVRGALPRSSFRPVLRAIGTGCPPTSGRRF
jgi:hypothetical protein